jgi:hypothetical protein
MGGGIKQRAQNGWSGAFELCRQLRLRLGLGDFVERNEDGSIRKIGSRNYV